MLAPIEWIPMAVEDLEAICRYHEERGEPELGKEITLKLLDSVKRLESFPEYGRPWLIMPGTRDIIPQDLPYIVIYWLKNSRIEILRIFHTSRLLNALFASSGKGSGKIEKD